MRTCGGELARDRVEGALALLGFLAARRVRVDPCEGRGRVQVRVSVFRVTPRVRGRVGVKRFELTLEVEVGPVLGLGLGFGFGLG